MEILFRCKKIKELQFQNKKINYKISDLIEDLHGRKPLLRSSISVECKPPACREYRLHKI